MTDQGEGPGAFLILGKERKTHRRKKSRQGKQNKTVPPLRSRSGSVTENLMTEFTRGPGRGDTCHLSFLDETLLD